MAEVWGKGVPVRIVGMVLWKSREVKQKGENWQKLGKGLLMGILRAVARTRLRKSTYHFAENSTCFLLKIELMLTVLFDFEKEGALEDSAFSWIVILTHVRY